MIKNYFSSFVLIICAILASCSKDSNSIENSNIPETENLLQFNWDIQENEIPIDQKTIWETELSVIYNYFISSFNYQNTSLDIDIVYFTNLSNFQEFQRTELNRNNPVSTGFYSPSTSKIYMINENNSSNIAKNIFLHEGTHKIFNSEISNDAIILNEGLATVFQTLQKSNNQYFIKTNNKYESQINQMLESNTLYDLSTFLNFTNQEWQAQSNKSYAHSNSLVYFMLSFHPELLKQLIIEYKKPVQERVKYDHFISENYNGGLSKFETDWKNWIKENKQDEIQL